MSHAPGSPHAAPRAATGTPSYDPYAPREPYGPPPEPYAPQPYEPYGDLEPLGAYEPYRPHGEQGAHGPSGPPERYGAAYGGHGHGAHEGYDPYEPYEPYEPFGQAQLPRQAIAPPGGYGGPGAPGPHGAPETYGPHAPAWAAVADSLPVTGPPVTGLGADADPGGVVVPAPGGRAATRRAAAAANGGRKRSARSAAPRPGAGAGERSGSRAAPRERGAEPLRRLLPQALVVAFLAGGTSAFIAGDKAVQLSVDGRPRTLHTFAGDVEELLADEGMAVGEHDIVAPGRHHDLASGDRVIVRYGRPVSLTLDGERRQVWTTARTVDGALRQLGVRAEGAYLSASRSAPIGRKGLDLDVRTERTVTFMADGRERTVRTNAATVREAIEQAGIGLRGEDTTSVDPESFPREGQTISVMRISADEEVKEEPIDFSTERREDPSLYKGTEVVAQRGEKGVERVTYSLRTVNGVKQKPKKIRSEVVRRPRVEIVKVGTKARPTTVQGAEGLNWNGLAQCEAGGRPDAVDPSGTYGGLYQFDTHTWQSLGGDGRPQDAPAEEQTMRAKKLYVSRGASPWPVCGRKLHG
ncbi:ubiquitin-like domain-containing protein [Streptomyces abikoensis]|uniref:ubiquitin-like domain-containing protein n=1 Tax=Streptomyces abikoensis TaxID=97398 RepID=UPI0033F1251D